MAVPVAGGAPRVLSRDGRACGTGRPATAWSTSPWTGMTHATSRGCRLDGGSWPDRMSSGGDFAWDPSVAPASVAWLEWDLPSMPFDASRIMLDRRPSDDVPRSPVARVCRSASRGSRRTARGSPTCPTSAGWWNVWVAAADGSNAQLLLAEAHDHAGPTWGPGSGRSPGRPTAARSRSPATRTDSLAVVVGEPEKRAGSGRRAEVAKGWHHSLDWGPRGIVCASVPARARRRPSRSSIRTEGAA